MSDALSYEPATTFRRTRPKRLFAGILLAVGAAWAMVLPFVLIPLFIRLISITVFALVLYQFVSEFLRSNGSWEVRIAGGRVYLRRPDEADGQTVELRDVEHVMVASYPRRPKKVFLLLRDGRCWEVPRELVFPVRPLVRAIRGAAPHVKEVSNKQMPERDPLHVPTVWQLLEWSLRGRDRPRVAAAATAVSTKPGSEPDLVQPQ